MYKCIFYTLQKYSNVTITKKAQCEDLTYSPQKVRQIITQKYLRLYVNPNLKNQYQRKFYTIQKAYYYEYYSMPNIHTNCCNCSVSHTGLVSSNHSLTGRRPVMDSQASDSNYYIDKVFDTQRALVRAVLFLDYELYTEEIENNSVNHLSF